MRPIRILLVFLMIVLPVLSVANAQKPNEAPITYGETLSGAIVDAATDLMIYSFQGAAGDQVTIKVYSQDTDPIAYLLDANQNVLADNDDISPDNLNAIVRYTLTSDGLHYIGVGAYAPGTFTVTLTAIAAEASGSASQTFTGTIDSTSYYVEYPVTLSEGQYFTAAVSATSGDLDTYLFLTDKEYNVFSENDDIDRTTTNSQIEYTTTAAGEYLVIVSRYGLDQGLSTGTYELVFGTSATAPVVDTGTTPTVDLSTTTTTANAQADWTILAYFAGDNNLESSAMIDLDEFEIAGGSNEQVRVVVLLDRSPEYDTSNGNWSTARIFEVGGDSGSVDSSGDYPMPLIDSVEVVDLGSINTGSGSTLTDFLLWGIQNYPAQNYIVSINDHGGGWTGLAGDDVAGSYISPFEFSSAFKAATEAAGMSRFALLINDACLMSSIEYLDAVAPYFDYALGASETMYAPGYDMTMLTEGLRAGTPIDQLSIQLIDTYMNIMTQSGIEGDQTPTLVDMQQFPEVTQSMENFAALFNQQPAAYAQMLGEARYNAYNYAGDSWLSVLVDAGDLLAQFQRVSNDPAMDAAAQQVIDAMTKALIYGRRGDYVPGSASLYNINFPSTANDFISGYEQFTTIPNWLSLLSAYYNSFNTVSRAIAFPVGNTGTEPSAEEEAAVSVLPPQVSITNIYPPAEVSVVNQAIVSMEVLGRNVVRGTFTVDQVQPDGSLRRVDTADIVTFVELEDGTFDYINLWDGGVNDFDFTWNPTLTVLSDGTNTNIELITTRDNQSSITGRYRDNAETPWQEIIANFNDEGYALRGISTGENGDQAAASVVLRPGGEFQAYTANVTADGVMVYEPGNVYSVPETGLYFDFLNAPAGEYKLGFLIEALGGMTGFNSISVAVNNEAIDQSMTGYTSLSNGFTVSYPADWTGMEYLTERDYFFAADVDSNDAIYIYPVFEATDTASTVQGLVDTYELTITQEPTPITVGGYEALEFAYTDVSDDGRTFTGKGFAIYRPDLEVGYVFASENTDGVDPTGIYQMILNNVRFIDAVAVESADQGVWDWDFYTENTYYPVPLSWLPGAESDFGWTYTVPEVPGATAAVSAYNATDQDAAAFLQELLLSYPGKQPGYTLEKTETYYGDDDLTWEVGYYTAEGVTGRLYVTVVDSEPYALWFEAPTDAAEDLFLNTFDLIVDGFEIEPVAAE